MLLATRCPHCKTTFKVANDQLKLQSGLVRCGVCQQVFNGIEHLAPTSAAAPSIRINPASPPSPPAATVQSAPAPGVTTPSVPAESAPALPVASTEPDLFASLNIPLNDDARVEPVLDIASAQQPDDTHLPAPLKTEFIKARSDEELGQRVQALLDQDMFAEQVSAFDVPLEVAHEEIVIDKIEDLDNTFSAQPMLPEEQLTADPEAEAPAPVFDEPSLDEPDLDDDETASDEQDFAAPDDADRHEPAMDLRSLLGHDTPADEAAQQNQDDELEQLLFIRQARHRQRLKWILSLATLMLLVTLAGQIAFQFRDLLAAEFPEARGSLTLFCQAVGCKVRFPAQLDAISYEADELHTLPKPGTFEFGMLLKNHMPLTQAWPSIELTLKDSKKQVVLKKVFAPSDYLATPRDELGGFQGNSEQPVKLYFVVDRLQATDYVVSIFYP